MEQRVTKRNWAYSYKMVGFALTALLFGVAVAMQGSCRFNGVHIEHL